MSDIFSWIMQLGMALFLYFVPALTAKYRKHPGQDGILVLNLFLGWTVLGWVIALVWAMSRPVPPPPATTDGVGTT